MSDNEHRTSEGEAIQRAREAKHMAVRVAARLADMSEGRWRQIEKGYQAAGRGNRIPVIAPARTLASMARVVGVSADQLDAAGRSDAAEALRAARIEREPPPPDLLDRLDWLASEITDLAQELRGRSTTTGDDHDDPTATTPADAPHDGVGEPQRTVSPEAARINDAESAAELERGHSPAKPIKPRP